ncbi:MAG: CoA transferase, partial [Janthinobacterium lividum]
ATNALRLRHRERLRSVLSERLAGHEAATLARSLLDQGVPAAAIADVGQVLSHPHTHHREMVVEHGEYRGLGPPVKLSRTPASVRRPPPHLNEHGSEIAGEHGLRAVGHSA